MKTSPPKNDLATRDAQRRSAQSAVPSRLPPSPRSGAAQTQLLRKAK